MHAHDLNRLTVLFLDCQTTGANPKKHWVVEIGWARSHIMRGIAPRMSDVHAYLLKRPAGNDLPLRVQAVTGINPEDLNAGHEPTDIWSMLVDTAGEIARLNGLDKCPLVIHFARFEVPFLVDFHDRYSKHAGFPFKLICTHVIAKRLFPELPRRSLRAMAGYFGYSLGQTRRCSDHVLATAFIWHAMLGILRGRFGIKTLEQLQEWLNQPFTSELPERTYPMADEQRSSLPHRPGVYRMRRSNGDILYIGKAGSLRNRVNSYFHRPKESLLKIFSNLIMN